MAVVIDFENLVINYGGEKLPPITLKAKEGEIIGIESERELYDKALLDFFLCFNLDFEGTAHILDTDLSKLDDNLIFAIRKNIAAVSLSLPLISNLKLIENVYLQEFFFKNEKESDAFKRAFEILKFFGIENKFNLNPAFLTNFEKKLALFARALMGNYKIIFFSRVFSDTDSSKKSFLLEKILEQKRINDKITIIVLERVLDEFSMLNFDKKTKV